MSEVDLDKEEVSVKDVQVEDASPPAYNIQSGGNDSGNEDEDNKAEDEDEVNLSENKWDGIDAPIENEQRKIGSGLNLDPMKSLSQSIKKVVEEKNAFQSNFATIWKNKDQDEVETIVTRSQVQEKLIETQTSRFMKMFPFERSQYHQCIPHPVKENEFITVQIVNRQMDSVQDEESKLCQSRKYQRYNIKAPEEEEDEYEYGSSDESEKNEDEEAKKQDTLKVDELKAIAKKTEAVDPVIGIKVEEYARLDLVDEDEGIKDREIAIVGFWKLKNGVFRCLHSFQVPNPIKRQVLDVEDTPLYQVLWTAQTGEVFFFFERNEKDSDTKDMILGVLDLESDLEKKMKTRHSVTSLESTQTSWNCSQEIKIKKESILEWYLLELGKQNLQEQKQLPNPTIVQKGSKYMVVFSAYAMPTYTTSELYYQKEEKEKEKKARAKERAKSGNLDENPDEFDEEDNSSGDTRSNHYPSIFFYNLGEQELEWEILGGELFIHLDEDGDIFYLTNEAWFDWDETDIEYYDYDKQRYQEKKSYINVVHWKKKPSKDALDSKSSRAPPVELNKQYLLYFGANKNLEIGINTKVVSAHVHNNGERVTLVYRGNCAFTFVLGHALPVHIQAKYEGKVQGRKFKADIKFPNEDKGLKFKGTGKDDTEKEFDIIGSLEEVGNDVEWQGFYVEEKEQKEISIDGLQIEEEGRGNFELERFYDYSRHHYYSIKNGKIEYNVEQPKKSKFYFEQHRIKSDNPYDSEEEDFEEEVLYFYGTCYPQKGTFEGSWGKTPNEEEKLGVCSFKTVSEIKATINVTYKGEKNPITITDDEVRMKLSNMKFKSRKSKAKESIEMKTIEHLDNAQLAYLLTHKDVAFIQHEQDAYVQAQLTSTPDDDTQGNGDGYVDTKLQLYKVSEPRDKKEKHTLEPKNRLQITFLLNQNFLKTQEKQETQLWSVMPIQITNKNKVYGSVIYEEFGSDDLVVEFFTSRYDPAGKIKYTKEYPQTPLAQEWIVDYPLLAYKHFSPENDKIVIIHMAMDVPQKVINLGDDWEFLHFVNHTAMVETKLFDEENEINCDIMFIAQNQEGKKRLMSFKQNPWLSPDYVQNEYSEHIKHSIYLFSGVIAVPKNDGFESEKNPVIRLQKQTEKANENKRRFDSDKIQSIQLVTKKIGSFNQMTLLMQYNDIIVSASLNENNWQEWCSANDMVRRHFVRGYHDQVYFAETSGNAQKIFKLELHANNIGEITKKEIYSLAGSWMVAFETDCENVQDDKQEQVKQAFYIMDDNQKIYHLVNEDGVKFQVAKTIDFSMHNKLKDVTNLKDEDWAHVHISARALTFNDTTYSLQTDLSSLIELPDKYFGEKEEKKVHEEEQELQSCEQSDFSEEDSVNEKDQLGAWYVQSVNSMNGTTGMISVGQRSNKEFCFVVKPSPGSKRLDFVPSQQIPEIENMAFVSNDHIIVNFKYDFQPVHFSTNGIIVFQEEDMSSDRKIVAQSELLDGKKYFVFKENYSDDYKSYKYNNEGKTECVGHCSDLESRLTAAIKAAKMKDLLSQDKAEKEEAERLKKLEEQKNSKINRSKKLDSQLSAKPDEEEEEKEEQNDSDNDSYGGYGYGYGHEWDDDYAEEVDGEKVKYSKKIKEAAKKISDTLCLCNDATWVTIKGELILFAATRSPDKDEDAADADEKKEENIEKKETKKKTDENKFILPYRIFELKNHHDHYDIEKDEWVLSGDFKFKVIVFHCETKEQHDALTQETKFKIAGKWLLERNSKLQQISVRELPFDEEGFIQNGIPDQELNKPKIIRLNALIKKPDLNHVKFYVMPKSSHLHVMSRQTGKKQMKYYENLIQVCVRNQAIIYNLDHLTGQEEVEFMYNSGQFVDSNAFINTGFVHTVSQDDEDEYWQFVKQHRQYSNETYTLCFGLTKKIYQDGDEEFEMDGHLYQSYSELDLLQLQSINHSLDKRQKIPNIDLETILCSFEGHSIFSIYYEDIRVYEQIYSQLSQEEFEMEENTQGQLIENPYIRRLMYLLQMPMRSLASTAKKVEKEHTLASFFQHCFKEEDTSEIDSRGFQSILKKSVHFNNARFRDLLMEISMLSQDNTIGMFVECLEDLSILFEQMSPSVTSFFENCFLETEFCQNVLNADWETGQELFVFGQNSSIVDEKQANKAITGGKVGAGKGTGRQNRQITLQMLQIDWIFQADRKGKQQGFGDLVSTFANAPSDSLFSTRLVIILVMNFWGRYYAKVVQFCLIPYVIYFISTMVYFSTTVTDKRFYPVCSDIPDQQDSCDDTQSFWELVNLIITILGMFWFGYFEVVQVKRGGFSYFLDLWNYFDMGSIILNTILLLNLFVEQHISYHAVVVMSFVAMVLLWFKLIYWFRLFESTSFYIKLIGETLKGIEKFVLIFIFILGLFANSVYILNKNRESEGQLYDEAFEGLPSLSAFLNQYLLALGEFTTDGFSNDRDVEIVWILFILATFLSQITILNMLIAIMGDTFDNVFENKAQAAMKEKLNILNDFTFIVGIERSSDVNKFIFAASPTNKGDDEGASWDGKIGAIKKSIEGSLKDQRAGFTKQITRVEGEIIESKSKIGQLEEKVDGLQNLNQKQMDLLLDMKNKIADLQKTGGAPNDGGNSGTSPGPGDGGGGGALFKKLSTGLQNSALQDVQARPGPQTALQAIFKQQFNAQQSAQDKET